jgi:hypothetical protein
VATYFFMDDDSFWDRAPDFLQHVPKAQRRVGGRASYFVMGDWRENGPAALALEIPPGEGVNQHAHPCQRLEVVVRGSLSVEDGRILRPGDVMVSGPGEMYGPHVAGPDGATTFEIFSTFDASYRIIYETPEGRVEVNGTDPNSPRPTRIYGAKPTSMFGRA